MWCIMNYSEIVEFVDSLGVYKTKIPIFLKNHHPDVLKDIEEKTRFLDNTDPGDKNGVTFAERMFCIRNGLTNRPICPECKTGYLKFKSDKNSFANYCSHECSRTSENVKKRRELTSLKRYGNPHYNNIEKSRNTRIERYGSHHPKDFRAKVENTLLERYGNRKYVNWEKFRETNLKKYGVEHPIALKTVQDKCVDTFRRNHPNVSNPLLLPGILEKTKTGNRRKSWRFISSNAMVEPLITEDEYLNIDDITKDNAIKFRCRTCGEVFESWWYAGHSRPCPKCFPCGGYSNVEIQIYEFIREVSKDRFNVYHRKHVNREIIAPKEIDIVICDKDDNVVLLVEVDGLFFHSSEKMHKDKKYHLSKTEMIESRGMRLVHVFENEWVSNQEIVKSRLRHMLNIDERTIYARKCSLGIPSEDECAIFVQANHMQGNVRCSKRIGLYMGDELVSVMTFGRCRYTGKYEWELLRFCNKLGCKVVGGASRLLKWFERNVHPSSIVSYADRRWSKGDLYRKLGFVLSHKSPPNYWYFKLNDSGKLYSRLKFQKHKLQSLLKNYDESLSEVENMVNNKYDRIFDCGNLVFVKTYA